jgi:hypothetical protein
VKREGIDVEGDDELGLAAQHAEVHRQLVADVGGQQQALGVIAGGEPLPRLVLGAVVDRDDPGVRRAAAADDVDQHLEVRPRVPVDRHHGRRPRLQAVEPPARPRPQGRHRQPPAGDLRQALRGRAGGDGDVVDEAQSGWSAAS